MTQCSVAAEALLMLCTILLLRSTILTSRQYSKRKKKKRIIFTLPGDERTSANPLLRFTHVKKSHDSSGGGLLIYFPCFVCLFVFSCQTLDQWCLNSCLIECWRGHQVSTFVTSFCVSRLPHSGAVQFHSAFQHFLLDHTGCIWVESMSSTFMTLFGALDATWLLAVKLAVTKAKALTGAAWCICTIGCCCCSPPEPPTMELLYCFFTKPW